MILKESVFLLCLSYYFLLLFSFVYECVFGYISVIFEGSIKHIYLFILLPLEFMFPFLFTSATSGKNRDGNNF